MKNLFIALLFAVSASIAQTVNIEGVAIPSSLKAGDQNLVINGGGVREKYFMDMYVGALYLKNKNKDANAVIIADEPMAIKLQIVSSLITPEKMIDAVNEGFGKSTGGKTAPLQSRIDHFKKVFDKINVNDVYDFIYMPGKGVSIIKNGKTATTIEGLDFKKGLFGIWLCPQPADAALKTGMLGQN